MADRVRELVMHARGAFLLEVSASVLKCIVAYRFLIVYRQSPLGPVDASFRALSGRFRFTVRRHKFNNDSLPLPACAQPATARVGVRGV